MTEIHGHFDVLIVGAGLSGIDAAYHVQTACPQKTYALLEGARRDRRNMGLVPLPRRAFRFRHGHVGLSLPAMAFRAIHRRRCRDPELYPLRRRKNLVSTVISSSAMRSCAQTGLPPRLIGRSMCGRLAKLFG